MLIALDDVPVAALALDARGRVVAANALAEARLGIGADALRGRPLSDRLPAVADRQHREIALGDRVLLTIPTGAPPREDGMRVVLLVDVTDSVRAREQAKADARSRADFLGKLGHEIRSALASMIGFAELLRDGAGESDRELARIVALSGRHLIDTLDAVVDLSRIEFEEEDVELVDVDVVRRIQERVEVFRPAAERKGLVLRFTSGDEALHARVNPVFFDRILHNLIDNAVKYTEEGRIEVEAEERDGQVWVYVADTGRGMDESFIPRLFSPFEREQAADRQDGSGLGLAVTRYLVELMGGRVTACSTLGEGSTFTISLPAAARQRRADAKAS